MVTKREYEQSTSQIYTLSQD